MSLSLNCLVIGDDPDRAFTVEIPRLENVSTLKKLIKQKKAPHLDHVAASDLDLWQVSFPINDLEAELESINLAGYPKLSLPSKQLASFFTDVADDYLHVIAKVPGTSRQFQITNLLRSHVIINLTFLKAPFLAMLHLFSALCLLSLFLHHRALIKLCIT